MNIDVFRPRAVLSLRFIVWGAVIGSLSLTGCMSLSSRAVNMAEPDIDTDRYQLTVGNLTSKEGCRFDYRLYEPQAGVADDTLVIIGHGFLRHQNTLVGLARNLANSGYRTATLNFCNMQPWNGHHRRNVFMPATQPVH